MKRFGSAVLIAAMGLYFLVGAKDKSTKYEPLVSEKPVVLLPSLDYDRPIVVLVRGWLWDPKSRKNAEDLVDFPAGLREVTSHRGLDVQIYQFAWSRIPTRVFSESNRFKEFAAALVESVGASGHCVDFIGHSAGAAMVYGAAAAGVRMGYMGTLGLPTAGTAKPAAVHWWGNFYTSTHVDDVPGRLWGSDMKADVNMDLRMPHKDFWDSQEALHASANGVLKSWESCTV